MTKVKICGLKTLEGVEVAINNNADFLGFVFFDKSPRNISIEEAKPLFEHARNINKNVKLCCVLVKPDDALLVSLKKELAPDFVQIHGDVSQERVKEIKNLGLNIIMAFGISEKQDLEKAKPFYELADYILFDAKPPKNSTNAGGFGISFDWEILKAFEAPLPWFLSGGLNPDNVKDAIAATNAQNVDVSSGIEASLGIKDMEKIKSFLKSAKGE